MDSIDLTTRTPAGTLQMGQVNVYSLLRLFMPVVFAVGCPGITGKKARPSIASLLAPELLLIGFIAALVGS